MATKPPTTGPRATDQNHRRLLARDPERARRVGELFVAAVVTADVDEPRGLREVARGRAVGPRVVARRAALGARGAEQTSAVEQGVDDVKPAPALPVALWVRAARGDEERFVEPLPREGPVAGEGFEPGVGEESKGEVVATTGFAKQCESRIEVLAGAGEFRRTETARTKAR
jgi:hypothetical protein